MQVNLDKLIKHKLPIEAYFICWCVYNEETDKLSNYINNIDIIDLAIFDLLVEDGWIIYPKEILKSDYDVAKIELTEKFPKQFLGVVNYSGTMTFDDAFQQLRDHFPIKAGSSERRLQGNIDKCKIYYKNIITKNGRIDEALHSLILQCINYEINLRSKARSLEYFKLLTSWLNQKEWELYQLEVEEVIRKEGFVDKRDNGDNEGKTIIGNTDF